MRLYNVATILALLMTSGQVLAIGSQAQDPSSHKIASRQLVEPSSETLQGAASDLYDDLKQTGAGYVDETEEFLEEYFPEIFGSTDEDEVDPFGEPAELTLERVKGKGKNKGGKHGPVKGNGTEPDSPDHLSPFGIFSEPLITSLLVTFVVFVPLVGFGIMAMSSIQVPPHLLSTAKTSGPSQAKKEQ